jgi:formylglycine-generating enzyme required for sulfatase activity
MFSFFLRLLLVLSLVPAFFPAVAESVSVVTGRGENIFLYKDYHALVIGVSAYKKRPALPDAVRSARELSAALQRMGFKVTLVTDPSSKDLKKAFHDLVKGPGREPERGILVFYTGHGETQALPDGTRAGWLIPRDCPLFQEDPKGFADCAISMKDIETYSVDIQSRHVLMIFDAAFSGAAFSLEPPVLSAITDKSALPVRQYLIAANEGDPLPEPGQFLRLLLKGLEGEADIVANGFITGSELGVYLENTVLASTEGKQHLQFGTINVPSLAGGDFIFQRTGTKQVETRPETARLTVRTDPEDAQVTIMNIKQPFSQGMELKPGRYHVEVAAKGYQRERTWTTIAAGEDKTIEISLKKLGQTVTNSLGMKFVSIEQGTFMMGSSANKKGAFPDETSHRVALTRGYYLSAAEVTVGSFRQFVTATGYKTDAETMGGCWISTKGGGWKKKSENNWKNPGSSETASAQQRNELPVTCVSWNDAQAFIKWLSKKEGRTYGLPTEAEWEYACRAGTTTPFAFGNCLSTDQANYGGIDSMFSNCKSSYRLNRKKPVPVATLAANSWRLFDMHGNVAEWCEDWYGPYPSGRATDPKGPSSGTDRVLRGCHWLNTASECRSAKRFSFPPSYASDVVGFRVLIRPQQWKLE